MSSENGPHSNVIKIFPLDRSEAQMFCISFNNLTVLTGLAMHVKESAIYMGFFYSNLFGIVQQTAKSSKIAVPIFQFGAANAVPKFQLGAANAVPNFQFGAAIAVPNFQFGAANAVPKFQLGAANAVPNFQIASLSLQMQCQLAVRNINAS